MTTQNKLSITKGLAISIAVLNILIVLAGYVMGISLGAQLEVSPAPVISVSYSVLAVLILSRNPRHTVGWLFLLVGFFSAFAPPFEQDALTPLISERVMNLGVWFGELIWVPVFMIPITLILQFFPDGRLPSRRWWPITAASVLGIMGLLVYLAFYPWEVQGSLENSYQNPFGIAGREGFFNLLENIYSVFLLIGVVGSLIMVVVRFRKARGIQRAQMKWLVYTAILGISFLLLSSTNNALNAINDFLLTSFPIVMAIAITIAILRFRLFDIDVIIRKTLIYGVLSVMLALVYFGSVVLLLQAFRAITGQDSPVAIVISTLVIAALFNPLRRRVQDTIDHRFYRRKYDAQQALAAFAATARDEVELEQLTDHLLSVVQESMQPEQVSLWLRAGEKK